MPSPSSLSLPHLRDVVIGSGQNPTNSFLVSCSGGQDDERDGSRFVIGTNGGEKLIAVLEERRKTVPSTSVRERQMG